MLKTLIWNKPSLGSDVQDPLGLELRVSTRMAGQLLHCITTITPRARYYSFLPWCVDDYRSHLKGQSSDRGLNDAIRQHEKALALGCITHHEGATCDGGGVVGSREAQRKWSATEMDESFDLRRYRRSGSLAWNQYFNSLVNLGCFEEMEPTEDDESGEGESTSQTSPDEIRLTPLGKQLADAYGAELGHPRVLTNLRTGASQVTLRGLEKIGSRGGVCEIMNKGPVDEGLLRQVFFDQVGSPGKSHALRRRSLLLIMDLIRQCAEVDVEFNSATFGDAVLYGATIVGDTVFELSCDGVLRDVADLWRMFYLHNHLSVALEGAFLGLIRNVEQSERGNVRFEAVLGSLDDSSVAETFGTGLGVDGLKSFLDSTPAGVLSLAGVDEANGRPAIGSGLQLESPLAEWNLAEILRQSQWASLPTPAGVAVSLTLLTTVVLRFDELREHEAALWCARNVRDPYLDLAPPLLSNWLSQWDRAWWNRTWDDLAAVVLDRFVIRQHELLGYDKGSGSDSMILHSNDGVLTATGEYGRVTIGNPRLRNAVQILTDIGFVEPGESRLSADGLDWLDAEVRSL